MLTVQPGPAAAIEEVVCLQNMLSRGKWSAVEVPFIERNIRILTEATLAGLGRVPQDVQDSLRLIDPMLRARWDFVVDLWAIERWVEEDGFNRWAFIAHRHELGPKLFRDLRAGDTWKDGKNPTERLAEKREAAQKKQENNEKAGNEKVLEAVDSLTAERMKRFVQVEEALATGDTILARGDDFTRLEALNKAAKKNRANPPPENPATYGRTRFKTFKRRER